MQDLIKTLLPLIILFSGCDIQDKDHKSTKAPDLKKPLTIERLFSAPDLEGNAVRNIKHSPDGQYLTFLQGKDHDPMVMSLWRWDFKTQQKVLLVDYDQLMGDKKENLSEEEKARRERLRIKTSGIVDYFWSEKADKILFPINGDLYVYDLDKSNSVIRLTETEAFEFDPKFSPEGNYVSFIRNHNIYIIDIKTKKEKKLTYKGTEVSPMGEADFIAQEEMGRYTGYWWAPDESRIAFVQFDNSPVEKVKRFELYGDKIEVIEQRYPKTGERNVTNKLGIVDIKSKRMDWISLPKGDIYLPHIQWNNQKENIKLSYQVQTRDQKRIELWLYDVKSKRNEIIIKETDNAWVNVRHDLKFLKNSPQFFWISEKSGFAHIYLYDYQGELLKQITKGKWPVDKLLVVDEDNQSLYFSAWTKSPAETHIYTISYDKISEPTQLTKKPGVHHAEVSVKGKYIIDHYSNLQQPPQVFLLSLSGENSAELVPNEVKEGHPLYEYSKDMTAWQFGTVNAKDGTVLHYRLLRPKNFKKNKKYPLVQFVYGGPGKQMVTDEWGGRFGYFPHILAQNGYVVLVVDNRGTPGRGRDFERAIHNKFGVIEVEDQSYALEQIIKQGFVDQDRIGVFGHSYGGYMTLMLLMKQPELYKVGVAGGPVTTWDLYDTHYTERYIGKPKDNPEVYKQANILEYTDQLKGRVLAIHGMADDNVLYAHSTSLYQKLQQQGKLFDIMAYPGAKHGIRNSKETKIHHFLVMRDYFLRNL